MKDFGQSEINKREVLEAAIQEKAREVDELKASAVAAGGHETERFEALERDVEKLTMLLEKAKSELN